MRSFWVALQLLTRIPVLRLADISAQERGHSVLYYPVVGLLIGALLTGVHALLELGPAAEELQAALLLLVWVLVTGGLHLDGLADSADAWAGSHGDRQQALRIMKDAASGPAAVTAVVLVLLLKFSALSVLIRENVWVGLLIAPVLGRLAIVFLFLSAPYVRPGGLGSAQAQFIPRMAATVFLILAAVALFVLGRIGIATLVAGFSLLLILRAMMMKRLGGATGDTLGAACELVETAALMAIALVSA